MRYYIIRDGKRHGPFSMEQLKEVGVSPGTKVWHKGLEEWTDAKELPELAEITDSEVPPMPESPDGGNAETEEKPPMPKTWLVESIIVTLLCCLPFGIAAIVYATQVETAYMSKQYDTACEKSDKAKTMILWGIGIGVAFTLLYIAFLIILTMSGMR